jgi:hypothetical protein
MMPGCGGRALHWPVLCEAISVIQAVALPRCVYFVFVDCCFFLRDGKDTNAVNFTVAKSTAFCMAAPAGGGCRGD